MFDERDWLEQEIARAERIVVICDRYGELDGGTAARSQKRALEKALAALPEQG